MAPIFFMLIFGIMIYGYYFLTLGLVHHIAYEAARASVSGLTDDERSSLAHARAAILIGELNHVLDTSAITVDAAPAGTGIYAVTVHYNFSVAQFIGGATSILPLPPSNQSATVELSHGGY